MKVVLAIDSYKGSLSSFEAATAVERGIRKVYPGAKIEKTAIGDGGEGTLEAFSQTPGAEACSALVLNPLGKKVRAKYVLFDRGGSVCAGMEAAQAVGITLLKNLSPMEATTFGLGELILKAAKRGAKKFYIGLGGTATTDGGMGMLAALGVKFFDKKNSKIASFGGRNLIEVSKIDASEIAVKGLSFEILCDVKNPLCGPEGAVRVFAPQKGATPKQVELLEKGMRSYSEILSGVAGFDVSEAEGAGAAGGLGAAFMGVLKAKRKSGIEGVLEAVSFSKKLKGADFVVTGEGRLDSQSAMGKAPEGVARFSKLAGVPVIAIGGGIEKGAEGLYKCGVNAMFSSLRKPASLPEAMAKGTAFENLEKVSENIFKLIKAVKSVRK